MEDWVFGVFCLALFAVPENVPPGGRVGEGQLSWGNANYRPVLCM